VAGALILLGAVCFTLIAAYQWTAPLWAVEIATTEWAARGRGWNTAFAAILWLIWFSV
jgi:hypothetical protein